MMAMAWHESWCNATIKHRERARASKIKKLTGEMLEASMEMTKTTKKNLDDDDDGREATWKEGEHAKR